MTKPGRKHGFSKKERLTHKKEIEGLFKNGSSFYLHPIMLKFHPAPDGTEFHKVLITVSKKNFKRAVDRNLLKRRLREAYRLNKDCIHEISTFYHLGLVYVGKTILPFQVIEDKLKVLLRRLEKQATSVNQK